MDKLYPLGYIMIPNRKTECAGFAGAVDEGDTPPRALPHLRIWDKVKAHAAIQWRGRV